MKETPDQVVLKSIINQKKGELTEEISLSDFFELFSAEQVLKDDELTWEELESGIVGKGGDGGIDSIYCLINNELIREDTYLDGFNGEIKIDLHIIQSKYENGFKEDTILKFKSTCSELLDISQDISGLSSVYNEELLNSVSLFRKAYEKFITRNPETAIHFHYVTRGNQTHSNTKRKVNELKKTISRLFSGADFSFNFIGARELVELTRRRPKTTYRLELSDSPISTITNSYVCLVKIKSYYEFITDGGTNYIKSMFDSNVRDHQGNVQVNQGIRDTLVNSQGEDFWWLNNGVSILASQANLSGKTLTLENPKIVNGLQTSIEIFKNYPELSNEEDRSLLVRIIVPDNQDSNERIIKATNSQTSIPIASLRATDKVHRNIEDYFKEKDLYYDRRKNQYKNEGKPLDKIVSISYVAQAVMSVLLGRPNDARARPSTLLKKDPDYKQVFNSRYNPEIFLKCTKMLMKVERYLKENKNELSRKDINNIKFHLLMHVTWLAMKSTNPNTNIIENHDFSTIKNNDMEQSYKEVTNIYNGLGGDDNVAKGNDFVEALKENLADMISDL
ncbi:AIPR family protein [bacterium]|nr:AIPR family protein [bacterium]